MYTEQDTPTIFFEDHSDFPDNPVNVVMGDAHRWGHDETKVFKHKDTGDHWMVSMYIMSGDSGEHESNGKPVEVVAKEVLVVTWEPRY